MAHSQSQLAWFDTPIVQRLLARLNRDNLALVKHVSIPKNYHSYRGVGRVADETVEALEVIRTASIEVEHGCGFPECQSEADRDAYMACDDRAPSVYKVILDALHERQQVAA